MGEESSVTTSGHSAGKKPVERLLAAIGYPERMSDGSAPFVLRVDGMEIIAEDTGERVVLEYALTDDEAILPTLASYASGRMLVEDAVLAHGQIHGHRPSAFLWQDAPADAGTRELVRLFETFVDSCDWWRERVGALRGGEAEIPDADRAMVIRP